MRVVLDTNIWISGLLLPKSNAGLILQMWKEVKFEIVTSQYIRDEIRRVLSYPKISKRLKWDHSKISYYLDLLSLFTESVKIEGEKIEVKADSQDTDILATLLMSKADYLISGDTDLLELREKYPILTSVEFLSKIRS